MFYEGFLFYVFECPYPGPMWKVQYANLLLHSAHLVLNCFVLCLGLIVADNDSSSDFNINTTTLD